MAGEGKTTVALGLALSAARLHQRVLLIDANLRSPSLHHQLNLSNDQGLSTLADLDYKSLNLHSLNSNTDILTAGPIPSDPVRVLSSKRIKEWIKSFEGDYDLVILDASSVLGIVDAIQTASLCNGVLMVARLDRITQSDLIQAVTTLGESNVLGIVANEAKNLKLHYNNQTSIEEEFFVPQQHGLLNNKGIADQLDKVKLP
ncbi:MAG: CpsD/CapB family tyrosine-protein kinase [Leptolyngbyaceae cyanobacterium SL_7_1]|nr:CpsD/CapB family tyrosine-protein kinase [Leptolyngbyaceae cyanobacterium SL_7_1]